MFSRGVVTDQQDGNKHYLLCEPCEQRASVAESYCRNIVMKENVGLRTQKTRHLGLDRYWRLQADFVAKFVAFTALRAHYAQSIPLTNTIIPAEIRKMLRGIVFNGYRSANVIVDAWRFLPPKDSPNHDPREDIYEMFEDGNLGRVYLLQAGGIEWMLVFDPEVYRKRIGLTGFQDRWIERICRLSYDEHRRFKYPEKWAKKLREKLASEEDTPPKT